MRHQHIGVLATSNLAGSNLASRVNSQLAIPRATSRLGLATRGIQWTGRHDDNNNNNNTNNNNKSVSPVEPPVSRLKTPSARSSPLKAGSSSSSSSCGIPLRASSGISSPGLSPASSCSRIPISKSQDDLIKNVHLRTNNKAN